MADIDWSLVLRAAADEIERQAEGRPLGDGMLPSGWYFVEIEGKNAGRVEVGGGKVIASVSVWLDFLVGYEASVEELNLACHERDLHLLRVRSAERP